MYLISHIKICLNCHKEFSTFSQKQKCCSKKCTKELWLKETKKLGHTKYKTVGRKKNCIPWNKDKECIQLQGENNGFYGKKHSTETKNIIKEKVYQTKLKNNSFNQSKQELLVKQLLEEKFNQIVILFFVIFIFQN